MFTSLNHLSSTLTKHDLTAVEQENSLFFDGILNSVSQ